MNKSVGARMGCAAVSEGVPERQVALPEGHGLTETVAASSYLEPPGERNGRRGGAASGGVRKGWTRSV